MAASHAVASIVARIAPAARILSLDVFDGASTASDTTIMKAINWVRVRACISC